MNSPGWGGGGNYHICISVGCAIFRAAFFELKINFGVSFFGKITSSHWGVILEQ